MPKVTIHKKFEVDPAYNEAKDLADNIAQVRVALEKELACVDSIEDATMQLICMFAMIDCLAQEAAGYPPKSKEAFCNFILKHQKQCDYLKCVEPVTLFYRVEELIDETVLIPGYPPEKEVSLESLGYLYAKKVRDVLPKGKAQEILDYIEKKKGSEFARKMAREHQLISLLYRMRSKAVHEMSGLGESMNFHRELKPKEPYYRDVGRGYVQNGNWVSDDVVELVIPNIFIRNILADCIDGYLAECNDTGHFPFSNNHMTRRYRLSWYDT